MAKHVIVLMIALAFLGGCTMIPDYRRPEPPVPSSWAEGLSVPAHTDAAKDGRPVAEIGWREFFADDPTLKKLVSRALKQNRGLRLAILDVQSARARYGIQRSELFPEVDVGARYRREQTPGAVYGDLAGGDITSEYYRADVSLPAYELDLFGRVRSLEEEALQQYLSTYEARRSAQIALVAEVASAYMTLLADRAQLQLAEETLRNRRESLELTRRRFEAGMSSELAVHQARTAVESVRSNLARFRRRVAQDENALRLLVGGALPEAIRGEAAPLESLALDLPVPADLGSELLLRRPDVLQAEHRLRAANADIGAARAAFFPRISLTGSYGTLAGELGDLFGTGTETWAFTPSISLPLFTGGRLRANLDLAQVRKQAEVAGYERAIQQAFREVADVLAARGTLDEQLTAEQSLVATTRESLKLSRLRFQEGVDSYLAVLDAQRELYGARQSLIETRLADLTSRIALYRTLGGGWREHTTAETPPGKGS